jgi:hypothetical protein
MHQVSNNKIKIIKKINIYYHLKPVILVMNLEINLMEIKQRNNKAKL